MESQGTDTLQRETENNKTGYTTPQYVHVDESSTALESQGMAKNQTEITKTDHISSHEIALESQGAYRYYVNFTYYVSHDQDVKDMDNPATRYHSTSSQDDPATRYHSTSSQDVRALESQGRHSSHARTPPNTMGCITASDNVTFNALESQETSCTSDCFDDLSALESQGRDGTTLKSQGAGCTYPAEFDVLESQEMNTTSSVASEEVLSVSAICESSALESQGKDDDSPSQATTFDETLVTTDRRLYGGTTRASLSQKSKVTCGSDGKDSSNGQGVAFTDSALPSSCFVGCVPSTVVTTLGFMAHEVEQWKPAFIGPSKTVLVYKHQPSSTPPIIKPFYVTMEAEYDHLVQMAIE